MGEPAHPRPGPAPSMCRRRTARRPRSTAARSRACGLLLGSLLGCASGLKLAREGTGGALALGRLHPARVGPLLQQVPPEGQVGVEEEALRGRTGR